MNHGQFSKVAFSDPMFQLNMRLNFAKFDRSKFKKPLKKLTPNNKKHHFIQHPNENDGARMLYQSAFIENELLIRLIQHISTYCFIMV